MDDCEAERGKRYVQMGHTEEGRRIFAEIIRVARHAEDEDRRFHTLLALTEAQVEAGLLPDAVETALFVDNQFAQTNLLHKITEAQTKKGQFPDAKQTAGGITPPDHKVRALSLIAIEEIRVEQLSEGRSTFALAVKIARNIEYSLGQVRALASIAYQQVESGQFADAWLTLDMVWDIALLDEQIWSDSALIFRLAQVYAKSGRFADAIRIGLSIPQRIYLMFLPRIVAEAESAISGQGDDKSDHFKQLIVPCAYYRFSAYGICGLLAELYPEQAGIIGRIVASSAL